MFVKSHRHAVNLVHLKIFYSRKINSKWLQSKTWRFYKLHNIILIQTKVLRKEIGIVDISNYLGYATDVL